MEETPKTLNEELLDVQKRMANNQEGLAMSVEQEIVSNEELRQMQKEELADVMAYRQEAKDRDRLREELFNKREEERLQFLREDLILRRDLTEQSKRQTDLMERQTQMLERISQALSTISRKP